MQCKHLFYVLFLASLGLAAVLTFASNEIHSHMARRLKRSATNPGQVSHAMYAISWDYKLVVPTGVQEFLDECRDKFRLERWNCPKKVFMEILEAGPLPSNREVGLTRALISASIVLSVVKSCSSGKEASCGCTNALPRHLEAANITTRSLNPERRTRNVNLTTSLPIIGHEVENPDAAQASTIASNQVDNFSWRGCDELVDLGFKVSRIWLDYDKSIGEADHKTKIHNYEVGRTVSVSSSRLL